MKAIWCKWAASGVLVLELATGTCTAQTPSQGAAQTNLAQPLQPVEAMIESAWLADPLTFQYALKTKVTASGVELHGFVPTQMLKQRAATIARNISSFSVVDRLQVLPNMEILLPGTAGPEFLQEADRRLAKADAAGCKQIKAQLGAGGVVTLTGEVDNLEAKIRFAQSLRGLTGCAAVRNHIQVGRTVASRASTLPTPTIRIETPPLAPKQPAPVVAKKAEVHPKATDEVKIAQAEARIEARPIISMTPTSHAKPPAKRMLPMTPPVENTAAKQTVEQVKAEVKPVAQKPSSPKGSPAQIIFD